MSGPNETLKARHTTIYWQDGFPYPIITFDDRSIWRQKGREWFSIWLPEPKPAPAATPERPNTYPSDQFAEHIKRIASLETELRITKERFESAKSHAEGFAVRCKDAEEKVKAWERAANKGSQESVTAPIGLETRIEVYEEQINELKQTQAAATPERPKTITVDELRFGDEVDFGLEEKMRLKGNTHKGNYEFSCTKWLQCFPPKSMASFLARGVQVYRDGELISGWPLESPPWGGCAGRIAELEQEVARLKSDQDRWQEAASVGINPKAIASIPAFKTPEALVDRIEALFEIIDEWKVRAEEAEAAAKTERESHERTRANEDGWRNLACKAEAELAALKKAAEPIGALEPNRVIKTAHTLITEAAQNPRTFHQKGYLFRLAKDAIEALYGGSTPKLMPYKTKGPL